MKQRKTHIFQFFIAFSHTHTHTLHTYTILIHKIGHCYHIYPLNSSKLAVHFPDNVKVCSVLIKDLLDDIPDEDRNETVIPTPKEVDPKSVRILKDFSETLNGLNLTCNNQFTEFHLGRIVRSATDILYLRYDFLGKPKIQGLIQSWFSLYDIDKLVYLIQSFNFLNSQDLIFIFTEILSIKLFESTESVIKDHFQKYCDPQNYAGPIPLSFNNVSYCIYSAIPTVPNIVINSITGRSYFAVSSDFNAECDADIWKQLTADIINQKHLLQLRANGWDLSRTQKYAGVWERWSNRWNPAATSIIRPRGILLRIFGVL